MSSKPRCVFDTNVIVSAALYEYGNPGQAFDWALDNCGVLLSDEVAQEIHEVLSREKFSRYITTEGRELFLQRLVAETHLVEVTLAVRECRDPKDDKFLELAVCGDASRIITGDGDLLELDPYREDQGSHLAGCMLLTCGSCRPLDQGSHLAGCMLLACGTFRPLGVATVPSPSDSWRLRDAY